MRRTPASVFESDEPGFVPLWREPGFRLTLVLSGAALAALPLVLRPGRTAWPAAALALPGLLAAVDLGAVARSEGAVAHAVRGVRFAALAAAGPLFVVLSAASIGVAPGRGMAVLLLALGAVLAVAAIAPLEVVPAPGDETALPPAHGGPVLTAAGAALSLATGSLWQARVSGALGALAPGTPLAWLAVSLVVAVGAGAVVAATGVAGGLALRQLRRHSLFAPRAVAAALLLASTGSIAAAGLAWF
jgi:hypothetical protein